MVPPLSFNRKAVRPFECLEAGFALIKGQYWLLVAICLVGILLAGFVPLILVGPVMCGIYLVLFQQMRGRRVEFGMLFKGFDHFVDSLIATLLKLLPVIVLLAPFYGLFLAAVFLLLPHNQGGQANQPAAGAVAAIVGGVLLLVAVVLLVSLVMGILFAFAYPLIVDRRLSGIEAVKLSIRGALANFWGLAGLFLLSWLLSAAGVMLCYVGLFLVIPVYFASLAIAYRQVFGLAPDASSSSLPSPPPIT